MSPLICIAANNNIIANGSIYCSGKSSNLYVNTFLHKIQIVWYITKIDFSNSCFYVCIDIITPINEKYVGLLKKINYFSKYSISRWLNAIGYVLYIEIDTNFVLLESFNPLLLGLLFFIIIRGYFYIKDLARMYKNLDVIAVVATITILPHGPQSKPREFTL